MPFDAAYALALKKLSRCERFEREVMGQLAEFGPETIESVLVRLRAKGMLNDYELARRIIESSHGRSVVGRGQLRERLMLRGANPDHLEAILANLPDESFRAKALLATRPCQSRAKEGRFLMSRGIDQEATESALDEVFGASE